MDDCQLRIRQGRAAAISCGLSAGLGALQVMEQFGLFMAIFYISKEENFKPRYIFINKNIIFFYILKNSEDMKKKKRKKILESLRRKV